MTVRPDPTFHASAKLAMQAPPETPPFQYHFSPLGRARRTASEASGTDGAESLCVTWMR
jgi:hypothetical protein